MYRLTPPKILIYIPFVLVGILLATVTPNYLTASRMLSIASLLIGQLGMSFVPVIALFPKANLAQSVVLAVIYFITTFIICSTAWGLYALGLTAEYAFIWQDEQFNVNIASLFVANAAAFGSLTSCFSLIFDQELAKEHHTKSKSKSFRGFTKGLSTAGFDDAPGPKFSPETKAKNETFKKPSTINQDFGTEDLGKPFDFEPEVSLSDSDLPIESSGNLYASESKEYSPLDDFFEDSDSGIATSTAVNDAARKREDNMYSNTYNEKDLLADNLPSDIKNDLTAIFEEYSSLDAIKKITHETTEAIVSRKKAEKELEKSRYIVSSDLIEEASFRTLEDETESNINLEEPVILEEIKEPIVINESIKTTQHEEILPYGMDNSELTERPNIVDTYNEVEQIIPKAYSEEEVYLMKEALVSINTEEEISASMFISKTASIITENYKNNYSIDNGVKNSILNIFNKYSRVINKTNQGSLSHILLESDKGLVALVGFEDKYLAIISSGKGEKYTAKLLNLIAEVEESL